MKIRRAFGGVTRRKWTLLYQVEKHEGRERFHEVQFHETFCEN